MGSIVNRNSARVRMSAAPKRQNIHFTSVQQDWVAVINTSRQQIQAKGRGARTIFNPGDIGADQKRRAVQFISTKHAKQMVYNARAFLKAIPLKRGKMLLKLAEELQKQGVRDAYFVALARLYPQFGTRNELDVKREQRELAQLRTRFKAEFGIEPDAGASREELKAKLNDKVNAFEKGWLVTDGADDIELDDLGDEPVGHEATVPDIHYRDDDDEPDEDDIAPEPEPLEKVKKQVVQSDDARRAELLRQLNAVGIRPHGRTGTGKLQELLAKTLAAQSATA